MKSVLIVSLDFELYWGLQDCRTLASYRQNILGGRKAIPYLLKIFRKHGIHATWATVGMMFADGHTEAKEYFPTPDNRPTYKNNLLSSYHCVEDNDCNEKERPWLYAPSLIRQIAKCEGMEIGSHTFSHYYCREKGQTTLQFAADMNAAKAIAAAKGYALKSVVLPRNQTDPEYTKVLSQLGFQSFRGEENDWIHKRVKNHSLMRMLRLTDVYFPLTGQGGYIPRKEYGVWNFAGSRMYKPYFEALGFMEGIKIHRIKNQMLHAAKKGLVFHLWWHPHNIGVRTKYHLRQLEGIFAYYDKLKEKYGMLSMNMEEAAEYFERMSRE